MIQHFLCQKLERNQNLADFRDGTIPLFMCLPSEVLRCHILTDNVDGFESICSASDVIGKSLRGQIWQLHYNLQSQLRLHITCARDIGPAFSTSSR